MLSQDKQSLLIACSFRTRNSQSNYNALKVFKTKPLCDVLLERYELWMNLGQIFDKFLKLMQESFGFSLFKLFADDQS